MYTNLFTQINSNITENTDGITNLNSSKSNVLTTTTTHKTTTIQTSATAWNMSDTLSGYTPLIYSLFHTQSSGIDLQAESISITDGSFYISGYGRADGSISLNCYIGLIVLWVKND